jgi:hypothetical protein
MIYNFKEIFENKELTYNEFISNYTTDIDIDSQTKAQKIAEYYKSIFDLLNTTFEVSTK